MYRKVVLALCIALTISASILAETAVASTRLPEDYVPWSPDSLLESCAVGAFEAGNCQDCKMECQAGPVEKPCWGWKEVCQSVPAVVGYVTSQLCTKGGGWAKAACALIPVIGSITVCNKIKTQQTCVDWDWCKSKKKVCKDVPCGD